MASTIWSVSAPRRLRRLCVSFGLIGVIAGLISCGGGGGGPGVTGGSTAGTTDGGSTDGSSTGNMTKAQLGEALFSDNTLSSNSQMSCATCHDSAKAFTDSRPGFPTSQGAIAGRFGVRQSPSIMYMAFSPDFNPNAGEGATALGGQFWDGRAKDLPTQAKSPLLNPTEMNNASAEDVVNKVKAGPAAAGLKHVYGANIFNNASVAFDAIVDAIAAFERTPKISPFSSKYDAFLNGTAQLNASELRGLAVFNGKAACSGCHTSARGTDGSPPLFTNFCYANLGVPKNPNNPFYTMPAQFNPEGSSYIDHGLGAVTGRPDDDGNFMTPTLRNVALTAPYFHNGFFSDLTDVVKFYNTKNDGHFGVAEVPATENMVELGDLKLTNQEVSDVVAFLRTLTDGYTAPTAAFTPRSAVPTNVLWQRMKHK